MQEKRLKFGCACKNGAELLGGKQRCRTGQTCAGRRLATCVGPSFNESRTSNTSFSCITARVATRTSSCSHCCFNCAAVMSLPGASERERYWTHIKGDGRSYPQTGTRACHAQQHNPQLRSSPRISFAATSARSRLRKGLNQDSSQSGSCRLKCSARSEAAGSAICSILIVGIVNVR